jgi:hypothetical protein
MQQRIVTGRDYFRTDFAGYVERFVRPQAAVYGVDVPPPIGSHVATDAPIQACVNAGRWIVRCPDCPGAAFVWIEQPLYFCASCFNGAVGNRWRPVLLLPVEQRTAIERALLKRPLPQNRNWEPWETLEMLERDNEQHGAAGV